MKCGPFLFSWTK